MKRPAIALASGILLLLGCRAEDVGPGASLQSNGVKEKRIGGAILEKGNAKQHYALPENTTVFTGKEPWLGEKQLERRTCIWITSGNNNVPKACDDDRKSNGDVNRILGGAKEGFIAKKLSGICFVKVSIRNMNVAKAIGGGDPSLEDQRTVWVDVSKIQHVGQSCL